MLLDTAIYDRKYLDIATREALHPKGDKTLMANKIKNIANTLFKWIKENPAHVALGMAAFTVICIGVPLTCANASLSFATLPIITSAMCILGTCLYALKVNITEKNKCDHSIKRLSEVINSLDIYDNAMPTEQEIMTASSLQELIAIAELWKDNEDKLKADLSHIKHVPPQYVNDTSLATILAEMKESVRTEEAKEVQELYNHNLKNQLRHAKRIKGQAIFNTRNVIHKYQEIRAKF